MVCPRGEAATLQHRLNYKFITRILSQDGRTGVGSPGMGLHRNRHNLDSCSHLWHGIYVLPSRAALYSDTKAPNPIPRDHLTPSLWIRLHPRIRPRRQSAMCGNVLDHEVSDLPNSECTR